MKRLVSNIVLVLLLMSCSLDFRSNEEIESLIDSNRDKQLFLSFWVGINKKDFKRVYQYEHSKRNLINGNFEFLHYNDLKIPFKVSTFDDGIRLTYEDTYYDYWEGSGKQLAKSGLGKAFYYQSISSELVKIFSEKHLLLKSDSKVSSSRWNDSKEYDYVWKAKMNNDKFKVIILNTYYTYYAKKEGQALFRDMEKKRDKLAFCRISITYDSFDNYQKMLDERTEREKNDSIRNDLKVQQKQRDIEDNRGKL